MRLRTGALAIGCLLLTAHAGRAQTEAIQNDVDKKLGEARKDRVGLEELLAEALKNNPDIRVAESKVRETEVELYQTRMRILAKVAILRGDVLSAKAAADEAASRYARDKLAFDKGAVAESELRASAAAMQKFRADQAVKEAELEFLTGIHTTKVAAALASQRDATLRIWDAQTGKAEASFRFFAMRPAGIAGSGADRIRKALDTPFKAPKADVVKASEVLEMLRKHANGVNIQQLGIKLDHEAGLDLGEPVPLGAFFQWAEDQFGWRFVVRDYGIVATDRGHVPPGATLLLDFWRGGASTGSTTVPEKTK